MIQHEITIVEESDIVSIDQLEKNFNIIKILKFPHNLILFEYYHDILIGKWNHDDDKGLYLNDDPKQEKKYRDLQKDFISLLAPLYSKTVTVGLKKVFVRAIGFNLNLTRYLFRSIDDHKMILQQMNYSLDCKETNFTVFFKNKKNSSCILEIMREWSEWGKKQGLIGSYSFTLGNKQIDSMVSLQKDPENVMAALIAMLTKSAKDNKIYKFHIEAESVKGMKQNV